MKVLVTGAGGKLGMDVVSVMKPRFEVYGVWREQLDVSKTDAV